MVNYKAMEPNSYAPKTTLRINLQYGARQDTCLPPTTVKLYLELAEKITQAGVPPSATIRYSRETNSIYLEWGGELKSGLG